MKKYILIFLLAALPELASAEAPADQPVCAPDGVAVAGYDLVSYHQSDGPLPGSETLTHQLNGLTYRFSSEANLATFREAPQQYLPLYRGWCAATLAMGRLVCPDYTNFKLEDGRLLLFELAGFTNGRALWNSDPSGFRKRADANFERLVK